MLIILFPAKIKLPFTGAPSIKLAEVNVTLPSRVKSKPFKLKGDSKSIYLGKTIIIATGATARWLGLESEEKFKGYL